MKTINTIQRPIVCFILCLCLWGCATSATSGSGRRFVQLDTPPSDKALIYFYRSSKESWVKSQKFNIYLNGEKVGALPYGCYFSRVVNPGKVTIVSDNSRSNLPFLVAYAVEEATKKRGHVELQFMRGGTYFIRLEAENKFSYIRGNLSIEDRQTALNGLKNTFLAP